MATHTTKHFPFFVIILMSLFIAAIGVGCGGGGGSAPPPPPAIEDAQGLFTTNGDGSAAFKNPDIDKALTDIKGMVYGDLPNQKFIFFDIGTNVLYEGTITAVTPDVAGTATVYSDGVMVANNVVVSGTVVPASSIDLTFAGSGDFVGGSIKGSFSTAYNNVATYTRIRSFLASEWRSPIAGSVKMAINGMKTSDVRVNTDSSYLYSSRIAGSTIVCEHSGNLTSNLPKNIYPLAGEQISDTLDCTIATTPTDSSTFYKGFASVVAVDATGSGTEMWYATTNGTNSIFAILTR